MPQPFTVEAQDGGLPLATFDGAGNLILKGSLITGGTPLNPGQPNAQVSAQGATGAVIAGASNLMTAPGGLDVSVAGKGLAVAEGTNAKQGTAVLVAGTLVVANTSVTANSRIFLTTQVPGGTAGFLVVSARTPGTSFTILSSNALDTSTVAYEICEPG